MTTGIKPYKYKKVSNRKPKMNVDRLETPFDGATDPAPLTGWVHGKKASDIEERFYRGCKNAGIKDDEIHFQIEFNVAAGIPGEDKVVDFVVSQGLDTPVDIDGEIGHSSSAQQGRDEIREVLLNEVFERRGMARLVRIKWTDLETQDQANATVKRLFL